MTAAGAGGNRADPWAIRGILGRDATC
jgi:hypothetical protein